MRLIDADALYERTAEWEAQALHMVEVTMNDEDKTKWRKWSAVLAERSAFKHDIADAPIIEERKMGRWINSYKRQTCSVCKQRGYRSWSFCPNCGADMRGEQDEH